MEIGHTDEKKETLQTIPLYHHSRLLEYSPYDMVKPSRDVDPYFDWSFKWLEKKVGFYPLFLSVGASLEGIELTGYQDQWRKYLGGTADHKEYRKKGEIENRVLFSFNNIPEGVFMDFADWHTVLNAQNDEANIYEEDLEAIFHPSWTRQDWLDYAKQEPYRVQLVVPELDLRKADSIWARNKNTKRKLENLGFRNVEVHRMLVSRG